MAITKASRRPSQNHSPRKGKGKGSNTSSGSSNGGNLYTHSSPPKVLQMNSSNIRQWLKAGDLEKLEDVIIDGQGQKLLKESSADDKVRAFLRSVPDRISKMDAIHRVVEEGDLRQTKSLLDRRKYAMSRDKNGVSLLHKAVINGRTEVAEYLAATYPEILNLTDADGRTPLHLSAAATDRRGMYDMLVQAGADEKARDRRGRPAQYYLDHPDDLALPTKAEPTGRNRQRQRRTPPKDHVRGRRPRDYGAAGGGAGSGSGPVSHATIRIWIHGRDLDKLEQMVMDGHGERLLNETAGSNQVNKFLSAVRPLMIRIRELHSAAINGDSEKVDAMTEGNARLLTSKDKNGLTVLHKAACLGHDTIVQTVLGTVRDLKDEPDNDGYTPIFYAAAGKNDDIYDMLVKAGADVHRVDKRKKTADFYRDHPMSLKHVEDLPDAPRNSGDSLGIPDGPGHRRSLSTDRHQAGDGAKGRRSNSRRDMDSTSSDAAASARLGEQDVTPAQVDTWIRQGDIEKLEQVLVDGHGDVLQGKTAWNEQARGILKVAPTYMEQIAAIHNAAARGDVAEVKELSRVKGPYSKSTKLAQSLDENGRLPLHLAAWYGHTAVIQFLAERYPAGIHIIDKDSRGPHHYAAMASDSKKAKKNYNYLVQKGASENIKDSRGNVASYYLSNPSDESRPPTPEKGAKFGSRSRGSRAADSPGGRRSRRTSRAAESPRRSPGRAASRADTTDIDMETVERLLLTGRADELKGVRAADPEVQELLETVPYIMDKIESAHRAAEEGETRDVELQLDRRKLAGSTLKDGANPLHRAAFMGNAGVVRYLAQNFPATMDAQDRNGRTPLHYAAGSGDGGHVFKLLQRAGARDDIKDKRGREPEYYLDRRGALRYTSVDQQTDTYDDSEDETRAGSRSPERRYSRSTSRMEDRRLSVGDRGSRSVSRASAAADIEFTEDASQAEVREIEEAFETLQRSNATSLLRKHLTRDVLEQVKYRRTRHGATLMDVIRSGVKNLDSGVGVYAPDGDAYTVFAPLFDPIIDEYHAGFGPNDRQPQVTFGHPKQLARVLGNLSKLGKYVISTRIRTARSLEQYPLNPLMTETDYIDMEREVADVLRGLTGDLAGTYYPLDGMGSKDKQQLIDDHFLFKEGDRFLQAANASRHWPKGRGIFHNEAKTFLVWISEEDHLRIISMEQGGNVTSVYARLVTALVNLGKKLKLRRDRRLGSVTFCPTNLGTAIRASVHVQLPRLARDRPRLEEECSKLGLQVRGTHGEHSDSSEGVFDLSNKRRLGLTEIDAVMEMYDGVLKIIQMEKDTRK